MVALVFLCLFLDNFLLYMLAPILDDVVALTGTSRITCTLLYCIKPIIALPFSIVTGSLVALIGPKLASGVGILCFLITCWLHALATSIWLWALARVIQSIASALTVGAGMYLIDKVTDETNRGMFMGLAVAGNAVGVFVGPLVGSHYFHSVGQFKIYTLLSSVVLCQLSLLLMLAFDNAPGFRKSLAVPERTPFALWKLFLTNRKMICLMIAAGSACTVLGFVEPILPNLIKSKFNLNDTQLDRMWAFGTLFYPITVPIAGYLSDCFSRHRMMQAGMLGFAILLPMWMFVKDEMIWVRVYIALIFAFDAVVDAPIQPLIASIVASLGLQEGGSIAFTLGDMAQNVGYLTGPFISIMEETKKDEAGEDGDPQTLMIGMSGWFIAAILVVAWGFMKRHDPQDEKFSRELSTPRTKDSISGSIDYSV